MATSPAFLVNSTNMDNITVPKPYFDALIRRADFNASGNKTGYTDPSSITISRTEYNSLIRASNEYEAIIAALVQGGITAEAIQTLIAGANDHGARKDSASPDASFGDDPKGHYNPYAHNQQGNRNTDASPDEFWRPNGDQAGFDMVPGGSYRPNGHLGHPNHNIPRQVSYGLSMADDPGLDDEDGLLDDDAPQRNFSGPQPGQINRTLYFCGLPERTTHRDLLSVIKGGKILSINMRGNSATVSFLDGAADFLAWAKKNDIYLHTKRVEVKWADRQFRLNGHIGNQVTRGASRNLVVRNATEKSLTAEQIREDMEHIHNLAIIDITFRGKDAYVSTNCCHNALYARTCMMSRSSYKGCKIDFYPDECDVPLPQRNFTPRTASAGATVRGKQRMPLANRFGLLNMDGTEAANSDEENRTPEKDDSEDDQTLDVNSNYGVRLDFLDS